MNIKPIIFIVFLCISCRESFQLKVNHVESASLKIDDKKAIIKNRNNDIVGSYSLKFDDSNRLNEITLVTILENKVTLLIGKINEDRNDYEIKTRIYPLKSLNFLEERSLNEIVDYDEFSTNSSFFSNTVYINKLIIDDNEYRATAILENKRPSSLNKYYIFSDVFTSSQSYSRLISENQRNNIINILFFDTSENKNIKYPNYFYIKDTQSLVFLTSFFRFSDTNNNLNKILSYLFSNASETSIDQKIEIFGIENARNTFLEKYRLKGLNYDTEDSLNLQPKIVIEKAMIKSKLKEVIDSEFYKIEFKN